ncbi:MAG: alpha-glucan family phosphorylase, partial [Chloroflexota bacterium]
IAYFSAEFAIHNSLPIYAGGLGVLAGDICKEASDLGLPLVAVGFMYPQGYFRQRISSEGWQEETYEQLDFSHVPIHPCPWPQGCGPWVEIQLGDRKLYLEVWQVRLGRVNLYLIDTNVTENSPSDRQLSARLYTADREQRLQQEIVLGVGGVKVLRTLGLSPSVWHANEGHTAFMMLERLREEMERGATFDEAVKRVQQTTIFTTHTPVPAGHDVFPAALIEKYFRHYWESLEISPDTFMYLGRDGAGGQEFNMTALAMRLAGERNAVSQLHGTVTRRMWHGLWSTLPEDQVPISHITNGIHIPTWLAPEMAHLYDQHLGKDWLKQQDEPEMWHRVTEIPDAELWEVRQRLKRKLIHQILERAQVRWAEDRTSAQQVLALGALLDYDTLTIAFGRRFTEYKRPALIFYDIERLKRIITNPWRPVQLIFAGKSHPADFPSKYLLHQVYSLASDRAFQGRIALLEDYDMHLAHNLVQGVDVWLNNPRRLQEASGSSGMKASLNGVPHLSIPDGWWFEGYRGDNGWAIGGTEKPADPAEEDRQDAESLYRLLEEKVVPLFYDRDRYGVPHGWLRLLKETICSVVPVFCARRMLKEYALRLYLPAMSALKEVKKA